MDRFSQILYDLGEQISTVLHVDENGVCQLNCRDLLSVQLQYFESKEQLLMATFLCDVPPGKYRERLFQACLIYNGEYPRTGTFGYSERNNQLAYFSFISVVHLTGETLLEILDAFVDVGMQWKESVEKGQAFPIPEQSFSKGGGFFELKP